MTGRDTRAGGEAIASSLWSGTAVPADDHPKLAGEVSTDVAIIGGGFLGLSTALHLTEHKRDVVLIEAEVPGAGASGRNGGQVIPGLKLSPDEIESLYGPRLGPRVVETVGGAADYLFDLIRRNGLSCEAAQTGWIQAAHSEAALAASQARARQWLARGANVEILDSAGIARMIGSRAYVGGWLDRRAGCVQPLSLAHELARTVAARGVRLFSHSPAISIGRAPDGGWCIETPDGRIQAEKIVIATNAYSATRNLWPQLERTIVPVYSMQVATRPLAQGVLDQILPGRQAVSDTRNLLRYFRVDSSGRLLMGTRGPFREAVTHRDALPLGQAIAAIFPELDGIKLDHVWAGRVAMTADHLPHLHELAPGVYTALGWNGRGVALGIRLGRAITELIEGGKAEDIGYPVSPLKPIPLHPLAHLAARAMVQYYRLKDHFG
jgi:glycine/D-amino acid oxidase-like deaminating enzyme